MCLAIPGKVVSVNGMVGEVDISGVRRQVSFALLDDLHVGDYVLVHVGTALSKIDEEEAQKTMEALEELAAAMDELEGRAAQ